MELINKLRRELEDTPYYPGLDAIYIKLMILKVINRLIGSDERKSKLLFKTIKDLQTVYSEITYRQQCTPEYFAITKKRISNILIAYRVEQHAEPTLEKVA